MYDMNSMTETKKSRLVSACCQFTTLMAVIALAVSCATHPKPPVTTSRPIKTVIDKNTGKTEKALRDEYRRWKGTKHKMGGTDKNGVDCSGFVWAVYKNVFKLDLPRTTKAQRRQGLPVKRYALQAGDLVFFKPPDYPRHVGIYLSKNEFVHASKSKGVTISQIDPRYWGKYYWTARRIDPNR